MTENLKALIQLYINGSVCFRGAANYSVDAYMPIEKIREILCRKFGGLCDVPNIIDEYMKNKEEDKEENPPEY